MQVATPVHAGHRARACRVDLRRCRSVGCLEQVGTRGGEGVSSARARRHLQESRSLPRREESKPSIRSPPCGAGSRSAHARMRLALPSPSTGEGPLRAAKQGEGALYPFPARQNPFRTKCAKRRTSSPPPVAQDAQGSGGTPKECLPCSPLHTERRVRSRPCVHRPSALWRAGRSSFHSPLWSRCDSLL